MSRWLESLKNILLPFTLPFVLFVMFFEMFIPNELEPYPRYDHEWMDGDGG